MEGACYVNGKDEKCLQNFALKSWKEETSRKKIGFVWLRIVNGGEILRHGHENSGFLAR